MSRQKHTPWIRFYCASAAYFARQTWMTRTCWRVLCCLLSALKTDGQSRTSQKSIAQMTGIAQPHISEALRLLQEHKVISQTARGGPYFLRIAHFYRGTQALRPFYLAQERARRRKQHCQEGKRHG